MFFVGCSEKACLCRSSNVDFSQTQAACDCVSHVLIKMKAEHD